MYMNKPSKTRWSLEDIENLKELYPNNTNKYISECLGRSHCSIRKMASRLKLQKNKDFISKTQKNKDNHHYQNSYKKDTYNKLLLISKKYKTKKDFLSNKPYAYYLAKKLGYFDDICCHMIQQKFSRPQLILKFLISKFFNNIIVLYDDRKAISPYELDVYLPELKLAFEYDGFYWHKNKKEKDKLKDCLCIQNNINLIRIKEQKHDFKNYIFYIKEDLIKQLSSIGYLNSYDIIDNISKNEILEFINDIILDYDKISEITQNYNDYKEFRTKEKFLYRKLLKLECIKKFTSHMKKGTTEWTEDECIQEINKYNSFTDFYKNSRSHYVYILKHMKHLLDKFDNKRIVKYNEKDIENIINEFKGTLKDFRKQYPKIYIYLYKNNKLNLIEHLEKFYKKHDISEIINHDYSRYINVSHFIKENKALYSYIQRQKMQKYVSDRINVKNVES